MTTPAPAPADLCTEAEIRDMVHTFYGKARADDALGPVFNGMVHDWDEHLATLSDFWSAVLLGTRRFSGMPMPKPCPTAPWPTPRRKWPSAWRAASGTATRCRGIRTNR